MKIIGHRGARGVAPENTLASLHKALEHHVDEIEFDVRVTSDAVVILHHGEALEDPNGAQLKIRQHSFDELRAHKSDLVSLEQVLNELTPETPLLIEIKPGEPTDPIIRVLQSPAAQKWSGRLSICSFDMGILRDIKQELSEIPLVVNEKWSGVRATHRARKLATKRLSMNQKWLWWGFIRSVSRGGWQLSAYTLNDAQKARRWASHGLYGVITDYPDYFEE
jgi:glycerophosphoryl diester phosphodiesterase